MKIDLPEFLPAHIAAQASQAYEDAMENREGPHAAMCKMWTRLRELLIADAGVRERMVACGHQPSSGGCIGPSPSGGGGGGRAVSPGLGHPR